MAATASTFMGKTAAKTKSAGIEKALMRTPKVSKLDPNDSEEPTTHGIGTEKRLHATGSE